MLCTRLTSLKDQDTLSFLHVNNFELEVSYRGASKIMQPKNLTKHLIINAVQHFRDLKLLV